MLLARGFEWQREALVFVFRGDVFAAFDNLTPSLMEKATKFAGNDTCIIADILEEMMDLTLQATLDTVQLDEAIPFNRFAEEGSSLAVELRMR